ncbi:hypothetical protein BDR26DRAFT_849771 [Obelidium mucronatum]|nr:hypothetical protein BDR26DRAFT_849771 [Obelidium mucronatum]
MSKQTFDVGVALYNGFTSAMTEAVNNARKSVKKGGGDPAVTGGYLILGGWVGIWIGIMAGFQGGLISLGQIAIAAGYCLKQGFKRTWSLVYKPKRLRGTTFFLAGFILVLLHYTFIGCLLETVGFVCILGYDHLLVV